MKLGVVLAMAVLGLSLGGRMASADNIHNKCDTIASGQKKSNCCGAIEIKAATALGEQVVALSKSDVGAALKISEDVARTKSKCFQLAFGGVLDGTGTASIGGLAQVPSGG